MRAVCIRFFTSILLLIEFAHSCMLDIVGARFHCAICDSVDICSNCESAGLPGNLDSDDGGHSSSHIMIKVHPLHFTVIQLLITRRRFLTRLSTRSFRQLASML